MTKRRGAVMPIVAPARPKRRVAHVVGVTVAISLLVARVFAQPARGAGSPSTWRLVEDLRIGGADSGAASFDEIRGLAVTRSGNIFVLDFKSLDIRVFSPSGVFLARAARSGQGPGELGRPNGLAVGSDDIVVASDPGNQRLTYFDARGNYLKQTAISISGFGDVWSGVIDSASRVLDFPLFVPRAGVDARTGNPRSDTRVRRIRANGTADTLAFPTCGPPAATLVYDVNDGTTQYKTSMMMPFSSQPLVAVTSTGLQWCTPGSAYRLLVGPLGGPLHQVVDRASSAPVVSAADRTESERFLADFAQREHATLRSGRISDIPGTKPIVSRLFADDQGRAWVQRNVQPAGVVWLEVFDPAGRSVATLQGRTPIGPLLVLVRGEHLYTVIDDANDNAVIVRYRIVK